MGKKNGKGKSYYSDGNLEFEGEYLNDEKYTGKIYVKNSVYELNHKNGIGKEYFFNGDISFEGEYLNGKKKGKGKKSILWIIY